jgi:ABC-type Fe3+/spermidine/putrescine transport system ATPase subunit
VSRGTVYLPDGRALPAQANGWAGGSQATLMVRPESVHVGDPADAPEASLRGRIVQTSFLGSETRVAVSCDVVDAPITAAQFGRDRAITRDLSPDREVAIWWSREDAVLLPEESTEEGE